MCSESAPRHTDANRNFAAYRDGTMDQIHTVQASTQKAAEDNSKDLRSAMSSSTAATATQGARYFDFFALPRELRDMIYDQFHRLHPDTPMFREAGQPELMTSHPVRTKPITRLLLVSKQISSEYKDTCWKRYGVIVSTYMDHLVLGSKLEETIQPWDANSFIHMHVGDWMNRHQFIHQQWTLSPLKDWLAHWDSQMPSLDSITVSIYLNLHGLDLAVERKNLEDTLRDFVSVPKLKELKVVGMDDAIYFEVYERGWNSKRLLVHWTPSDAREPTLIDCPQPYAETCCGEDLDALDGDSEIPDDSSSYYGDGNDSEESDGDFESDDEKSEAGNGSHVNADNGDDECAKHADRDASEDSDGMSSGGEDTTGDSQTT